MVIYDIGDLNENREKFPIALHGFHSSFYLVYKKLQKQIERFPLTFDSTVFNDLFMIYLAAKKEYLDRRNPEHLSRLALSIYQMQKQLSHAEIFSPTNRNLEIRWIPAHLSYPFATKRVMGCLIGFNLLERYELFDEENVQLVFQKHFPELKLVKESAYCHRSSHETLKIFYLEIEKKDGLTFSLQDKALLKNSLKEKLKNSIQRLSPSIFMRHNEEEVYKHILTLSNEIDSISDLPQAYISLDDQTSNEVVFRICLVHISPFHQFPWNERFLECSFVSERVVPVRMLDNHPVEARIFRLCLPRSASLLRSDGSLDFYAARKKIVSLITSAIGEFRDFNGGILIKQQELLDGFKAQFPEIAEIDPELLESFFYGITPLEKQVVLSSDILAIFFKYFLENREEKLLPGSTYSFKIYRHEREVFFVVRGDAAGLAEVIEDVVKSHSYRTQDVVYCILNTSEGVFFNCALLWPKSRDADVLIQSLQASLNEWHLKIKQRKVLKIALEYSINSLDPRIGGETASGEVLRLLFEGLTRFNQNGTIENGVAESIEVSSNGKEYTFKLRPSFWNDGSAVSAHDYEYAWKKILSPNFKTAFAHYFYMIKNAKEAKEGLVSPEQIGIKSVDDRTLKIELIRPAPYFLQIISYSIFSPVHRLIDQQHPEWPYQAEKNYPCNGPFQLKINQPKQGYQMVKNPLYWDSDNISMDEIILTKMQPAQAIQSFQKNEVQWIGNPFGGWHPFYQSSGTDKIFSLPNGYVVWHVFNTVVAPFNNLKLRQAFAYSIKRALIASNSFMSLSPAFSPLISGYCENEGSLFPDYNLETARKLFHEALEELSIKPEDFPPITLAFHEKGIREYIAVSLKQQWKECLGIECSLRPVSWSVLFNNMVKGDFQMGLIHWTSWIDDPVHTLEVFKSKQTQLNLSKWENLEYERLLHLSQQEGTLFQRSSYLYQTEKILKEEMPIIPLFYQPLQALVKEDLHVVCRAPCGPFHAGRTLYKKREVFNVSDVKKNF